MERQIIPIDQLVTQTFSLWEPGWLLLTSGDLAAGKYNSMTVSWGSLGFLWGRPFAQVVVRPHRYTFEFIEQYPTYTLCAFPRQYRAALNLLGTKSGRDGDKITASGLTPQSASVAAAPCYAEAELVLECRKLYWADLDPAHFIDPDIDRNYPRKDYHRSYFGQVLAVSGASKYHGAES